MELLQLSLVIVIAAILALLGRLIKQPPIIAYLITGIIAGPLLLGLDVSILESFAHLGVAFLLFLVGLSLDFKVLKDIGKIALFAGVGEMIVMSLLGFFIAQAFGFGMIEAIFIGGALAFSSAVVVVKLLSDKKEIETLHGRIALGILIIENFIAALVLISLPVIGSGISTIGLQLAKGVGLIIAILLFSHIFMSFLLSIAARNQEILFLFSIGWALLIAMLFGYFGFPIEIGALIAGISMAHTRYSSEITGKVKGIRDFFVVLFFIYFGSLLAGPISSTTLIQAATLSAVILIGKPIIIMSFMRVFGYKKRTNFLAGTSLAQISELSLVLILLGFTSTLVSSHVLSLIILVALITIGISSYSIYYSHHIFNTISGLLSIFDGKKKEIQRKQESADIILFGYNRIGFNLLKSFKQMNKSVIVVDYNPRTIIDLSRTGIRCVYGDANDSEFLEDLDMTKAKMVISTIPELSTNQTIFNSLTNKTIFIPTAHEIHDAQKLYSIGADYVIMPHFLGGDYMAALLKKTGFNKQDLHKASAIQKKDLRERSSLGHTHPKKDNHGK